MVIISPKMTIFMHKDKVQAKNKLLIYKKATENRGLCSLGNYYILILLLFCVIVGKVGWASHHRRKFVCHKHALLPWMRGSLEHLLRSNWQNLTIFYKCQFVIHYAAQMSTSC